MSSAPRIRQLPDDLIARIAAGEVVERPASALKELIENSLDAGATRVAVSVAGAGRARLEISDNGCGMTREEAHLALRRHATSKISCLEDLESIGSFGFRGEALPSIAAVSRLTLVTRSAEEPSGWELTLEGGRLVSEKPAAREPGTTVIARDLFFNTPARFKFLKSDGTERGQCLRVVEEAAFAAPHATFEIRSEDGRPVVFRAGAAGAPPADTLRARLADAWGPRWSRDVVTVESNSAHFSVFGLTTQQHFHQASSRSQYLYINRRPVQNRRLARAVYDAYQGQLPSLRHPGWTLFITVDPATIDVNVHPSKREVKLTHESELYGFLVASVREALSANKPAAPSFTPTFVVESAPAVPIESAQPAAARAALDVLYAPMAAAAPTLFDAPRAAEEVRPELADLRDPDLTVLGQIRRTFIVAHASSGLLLADQHAVAEKVAYERLLKNIQESKPQTQMMLVPYSWDVAMSLAPAVRDSLHLWRRMGFVIEPFGGSTFLIKGLPALLGERFELQELLDGMCDALADAPERRGASLEHRLAAAAACKSSIKAGDPLDNAGAKKILSELAACESPFTCPHGRPTVVRMPFSDLEVRFRRR